MALDALQAKRIGAAESAQKRLDALSERLHQVSIMLTTRLKPYSIPTSATSIATATPQLAMPQYFEGLCISMNSIENSIDALDAIGKEMEL